MPYTVRFFVILLAANALATPAAAQNEAPRDEFAECEDSSSHASLRATQCALFETPLDHGAPDAGTIELFVRKFPAEGRAKGQIWLVAGGPGESGASFYPFVDTLRAAAPGFDLLIPDHRGTGFSTRLCPKEEGVASEAGSSLAGSEWGTCFGFLNTKAERTMAFTISNAARDLELLMSRLDTDGHKYVYGVSYGTQLVLRLLSLGAQPGIDGVIFDSLVPLESNSQLDLSHRSAVTDRVGREVLRGCDARPECDQYFPDGAEQAVHRLLDREDIEVVVNGNLRYQLSALLDFPETREMLPNVIAGLQANDAAWLEFAIDRLGVLGSVLGPYPQSVSSIPLVSLISRSENNARPELTAEVVEREQEAFLFASPLPSLLLAGGIPTYQRDANFGVLPATLPRSIVLQGTLDPKTPYHGAEEHVAKLKAVGNIELVPVERAPHFILMTAPDELKRSVRDFIGKDCGLETPEGDRLTVEACRK
ncbi:MAG: alpha/beta fold hydrolase [Erythrobacter sp.]|uniref:alpha/beta fold hydrolase n=1 Tax=Erythrobacter sp. TaxID=1042 RepID=UPI0032993D27